MFQKSSTTAPTPSSGSQLSALLSAAQHLQHSAEHALLPKLKLVVSSPTHGGPVSGQLGSNACTQQQVGVAAHGSRQQVAPAVGSPVKQHMQPQTQGAEEVNGRAHLNGKPGGSSSTAELSRHHAAEPAGHAMLQTEVAVSRLPAASLDGVNNIDRNGQHQALHGKANSGSNQPQGKQTKCPNLNVAWAKLTAAAKTRTPDAAAKTAQRQGPPQTASEALPHCSKPGNEVQPEASGVQSEASGVHAYGAERLSREEWHKACCAADASRASAALGMLTAMQGGLP